MAKEEDKKVIGIVDNLNNERVATLFKIQKWQLEILKKIPKEMVLYKRWDGKEAYYQVLKELENELNK